MSRRFFGVLWRHPVKASLGPATVLAIGMTAAMWFGLGGRFVQVLLLYWLLAINATTFVIYGIDKWLSRRVAVWRVPELTLHVLAVEGGSIGAWLGMNAFRHKTIKASFRITFWMLVAAQIVIAAVIVWQVWRS